MADGEVKYKVVIDDDSVGAQLEQTNSKVGGLAKGIGGAFAGIATAVGAAAVAIGGASLKVGMDFEKSMSQVAATAGWTTEELNTVGSEAQISFARLEEAARKAGRATKFTASESAEALNYMALAGWDVEQQIAGLPVILDLAAAGNMDLAYASDLVTDSMSVLGLEVEDLGGFTDQLTRISQRSNTSIAQLGEAILVAGGQAKIAGLSVEDTNVALGLLANYGLKGAEGGTALRNALKNMYTPTSDAAKALKELGVATSDSDGNLRDFQDVLKDLDSSLGSMNEADLLKFMDRIFDTRTIAGANALIEQNGAAWDKLSEALYDADGNFVALGATSDAAATQLDNFAGDITKLQAQLADMGLEIYKSMQKPLREAASTFGDFLSVISDNGTLDSLSKTLADLGKTIMETLVDVLPIVIVLVNALLPPLLDIASAVIPAMADAVSGLMPAFKEIASAVLPAMVGLFETLSPILAVLTDTILPLLAEGWKQITPLLTELIESVLPILSELFSTIAPILANLADAIMPALVSIWQSLLEPMTVLVDSLLPPLNTMFETLLPILERLMLELLPIVVELFTSLLPPLITLVGELLPPLLDLFTALLAPILELVANLLPPLVDVFTHLIDPILEIISSLLPPLIGLLTNLMPIVQGLTPIIEFLAKVIIDVLGSAIDAVMPIIESITDVLSGVMDFITGVFTGNWRLAWDGIVSIFRGIINIVPSILESTVNGVIGVVNGLINGINGLSGKIGIPAIPNIPNVSLPRFHVGGIVDFPDGSFEGPILARRGEAILTESQQAEMWKYIEGGAGLANQPMMPATISLNNHMTGSLEVDGRILGQVVFESLDDITAFQ